MWAVVCRNHKIASNSFFLCKKFNHSFGKNQERVLCYDSQIILFVCILLFHLTTMSQFFEDFSFGKPSGRYIRSVKIKISRIQSAVNLLTKLCVYCVCCIVPSDPGLQGHGGVLSVQSVYCKIRILLNVWGSKTKLTGQRIKRPLGRNV